MGVPNQVSKIFNLATPLTIYVLFDEKWLMCDTRKFFCAKFSKLPLVHVLNSKNAPIKKTKKKKGWPSHPNGPTATPFFVFFFFNKKIVVFMLFNHFRKRKRKLLA